ncbi:MAG: hypothetical protein ACI8ZN_001864 [Bacteroidia bacterium]|jgi:hypothetical protein
MKKLGYTIFSAMCMLLMLAMFTACTKTTEIPPDEDKKVNEFLKSDKQRADSAKKAMGIK